MSFKQINNSYTKLYKSVWLFPAACLLGLFVLTALQISGSSVGVFYRDLHNGQKDPHTILGFSRRIRSDEWEANTSMIVAQARSGYPKINHNLGNGQDMALIIDVPYKDWSAIFKPQNLIFFVLPFANAFAFKWWFLSVLLATAVYFFVLEMLPGKRLTATLLAVGFVYNPFVQWWYQSGTVIPLAFSLYIVLATIKLLKAEKKQKVWWALILAYLMTVFALVLYPPFQIPCAIVAAVFVFGYIWQNGYLNKKLIFENLKFFIFTAALVSTILSAFYFTNKQAIGEITHSVYPGHRTSLTGDTDAQFFFSNFLSMPLQYRHANTYLLNQSEASNFLLTAPFLILPLTYIALKKDKQTKSKILITVSSVLFIYYIVKLFVPKTEIIFKPLDLNIVPNTRLFIGIGLLNLIMIVLAIQAAQRLPRSLARKLGFATAGLTVLINLILGFLTRHDHYAYISQIWLIAILAGLPALAIFWVFEKKPNLAAGTLAFLSLISAGAVHPVFYGPGPIYDSQIVNTIKNRAAHDKQAVWAAVDDSTYENLALMANARSITGTYSYPQVDLWRADPVIKKQPDSFNRFAHVVAKFDQKQARLNLVQADMFEIRGSPCSDFYQHYNVRFFISQKDYSHEFLCLSLIDKIDYPSKSFYILQRK